MRDFIAARVQQTLNATAVPLGVALRTDSHLGPAQSHTMPGPFFGVLAVDLLVRNTLKVPVTLRRTRVGQIYNRQLATAEAAPNTSAIAAQLRDCDKAGEIDAVVLQAGEGLRLCTEEQERWKRQLL